MAVYYGVYISEITFFETIAHKKLGKKDLKALALSVDLSETINDSKDLKKLLEEGSYLVFLDSLHYNNTYFEDYIFDTSSLFTKIIDYPEEEDCVIFIGTKKDMKGKVMTLNEIDNLISKEKKLKTQEKLKELGLGNIPLILTVCDEPHGHDNPEASREIYLLAKKDKI